MDQGQINNTMESIAEIPFTCPHCEHFSIVPGHFANKTGPCANCGIEIHIPESPSDEDAKRAEEVTNREGKEALPVLLSSMLAVKVMFVLIIVAVGAVVYPMMQRRQHGRHQRICSTNMAVIGNALNQYHLSNGRFPPPFVKDANGKPLYSWRVLLLPYMGPAEQALYAKLDLTKAWNHPVNRPHTSKPLKVYTCPADGRACSYFAITGRGTAFDSAKKVAQRDVTDGLARSICIVEVAGSKANWAEPVDLDINRVAFQMNQRRQMDISSRHRTGACHAICCDGTVRAVRRGTKPATLKAMATIAGGEPGLR